MTQGSRGGQWPPEIIKLQKSTYMIKNIKKHDLVSTFTQLKGNPKWSLITEPLWFIPFSLFSPFATLYMTYFGITSAQIGIIISVGFLLQVVFALAGGVITDKLGRRVTTFWFDFISWSIPCFIWAFAQNFWWFLIAAVINSMYQITNASWNCLFIEDCPAKHLTNAFTLIQICGMLSVFFSPIAIILVDTYSVQSVVSVLYFISGISMTLKFLLLYIFGGETKTGKLRLEQTKNVSFFSLFKGYAGVAKSVAKSANMRFVVIFMALTNIILIAVNNFFSLYITQHLQLSENLVPIFPMVRTAVMLLFVVALQNVINKMEMKKSLLLGFFLFITSHIVLLLANEKSLTLVVIYTVLEAAAHATVFPRKDALMAFNIISNERSRVLALFNTGMILISSPFGYIVGALFAQNATYPFIFNIAVFVLCILCVLKAKAVANYDNEVKNH